VVREFGPGQNGETGARSVRAAEYVRMSTEHQKYSTENQAEAIQQYAVRRGIEVVRTYADEGKSGLREALAARARHLELSDAEVARRANLAERRYGHYVRGTREPDFATFMRICAVLDVTQNDLLLSDASSHSSAHERWLSRLVAIGRKLGAEDFEVGCPADRSVGSAPGF
jgi:transcriptional regulator with XRE-family HTH domain